MRVAFVLSHCHYHGSSKYVLETGRILSEWGHEVHVFANTYDREKHINFHKIPAIGKEYGLLENFTIFVTETLLMKLKRREFDVTVAQPGRYLTPDVCHVRFLTKSALRLVKREGRKTSLKSKLFVRIEEKALKRCERVIAMTNFVKNELIKDYGVDSEKISVVYDGVDINLFSPEGRKKYAKEVREKLGIEKSDEILLFVGNPFSRKGLHYLIRSLKFLKNDCYKLLILGKSLPGDRIENYLNMAKAVKTERNVIYPGFSKEVYKYFLAANAFIFPTLYDPFGLVVLEAMASGLPVITSSPSYCGAAELIKDGRNGLLLKNPRDEREIGEKINLILEDRNLRKRLGRNARKTAERYTWDRTASGFLEVFESVRN